jgi:hypothetical protein
MKFTLAIAAVALVASTAANAQLAGTQVDGTLSFNGNSSFNYFNPGLGLVPAGFGNSTSANGVTIGSGTEFGFSQSGTLDITADFTDDQLVFTEELFFTAHYNPQELTFTSLTPGAFAGLSLASSNFTGLTYGVSGDTITINWTGAEISRGTQLQAVFGLPAAVPEPATWAMMLLGFAGIGGAMRRKRSVLATA